MSWSPVVQLRIPQVPLSRREVLSERPVPAVRAGLEVRAGAEVPKTHLRRDMDRSWLSPR